MATENDELNEGMSSEELDALTTSEDDDTQQNADDTTLAEEALKATEDGKSDPADETVLDDNTETKEETGEDDLAVDKEKKEEEHDPKDAVIGGFRKENRQLALDNAKLAGKVEAMESMQAANKTTEAAPKSPLELAEEAYAKENGDLEGFAMDGGLYREQKAFDDKQAAEKQTASTQQQVNSTLIQVTTDLQDNELSAVKMGEGLDLESVASVGDKYLTNGDKIDLRDIQDSKGTKAALREAYKIMVRRTLDAGNNDSNLLKIAMNAKSKAQTKIKPKKTDIDALTTDGVKADTGEAEQETHSKRLTNFMCS